MAGHLNGGMMFTNKSSMPETLDIGVAGAGGGGASFLLMSLPTCVCGMPHCMATAGLAGGCQYPTAWVQQGVDGTTPVQSRVDPAVSPHHDVRHLLVHLG